MYKLKQFLEENQDFKNYINTRINDNIDIDIIYVVKWDRVNTLAFRRTL